VSFLAISLDRVDQLVSAGPLVLALLISALAGVVSFASPCVVPLVPGYLSYLAAVVGVDDRDASAVAVRTARLRVLGAAALFVSGFTVVFVLGTVAVLGVTTTLLTNQLLLQRIGGVVTIVMGLVFVGLIPALQREARFAPRLLSTVGGAPLLGAVFALGWTPCLGPTLTAVIAVASATEGSGVARGVVLVVAYCLGLGIPFLVLAFGSARAVQGLGWLRRHTRGIQIFGGVLLILVGLALVTGLWADFVSWVRDAFVSDARLAHPDVDGHRAGSAVPACAGGHPRRPAPAAQPEPVQGRRVPGTAHADRPMAGPVAGLRRVLQLLVHGDLRVAVHLAGRVPHPATGRARPQPARYSATSPGCPSIGSCRSTGTSTPSPPVSRAAWRGGAASPVATATPSRSRPSAGICANWATSSSTSRCSACCSRSRPASCSATRATSSSSPTAGPASARRPRRRSTPSGPATPWTAPR
jgi:cytochrome c-type biogenesis protein